MKKFSLVLLLIIICIFSFQSHAQKTNKTAQKSIRPQAPLKKLEPLNLDLYCKNEDGSLTSEALQRGDKLVYHVHAQGKEYDFILTLLDASYERGVDFNYEMTDPINMKGHVVIKSKAKNDSKKYINYFSGGELILTDACAIWLSGINFRELPNKETKMTFDNGTPETFYNKDGNEVTPTINFKGKPVMLDAFSLNNAADGKGDKTLWVLNGSGNPLIVKMDLGWTIELKEIR